jgi:hypothetical protein
MADAISVLTTFSTPPMKVPEPMRALLEHRATARRTSNRHAEYVHHRPPNSAPETLRTLLKNRATLEKSITVGLLIFTLNRTENVCLMN